MTTTPPMPAGHPTYTAERSAQETTPTLVTPRALLGVAITYTALLVALMVFPAVAGSTFTDVFLGAYGMRMVTTALGVTVATTGLVHLMLIADWHHQHRVLSGLVLGTSCVLFPLLVALVWVLQGPLVYC